MRQSWGENPWGNVVQNQGVPEFHPHLTCQRRPVTFVLTLGPGRVADWQVEGALRMASQSRAPCDWLL